VKGRRQIRKLIPWVFTFALVLSAAFLPAATASSAGTITIEGPEEESHLALTVSGTTIVVKGKLDSQPDGCEFTYGTKELACPTAGIQAIEVLLGPGPDKIEVLSPLPVPLTVNLGEGEGTMVGNAEDDTCYSEGAKASSRCIGNAGDDVCMSDGGSNGCEGGPGNDICETGVASDHCDGGSGNDVCNMGAGQDHCEGGLGNDVCNMGAGQDHCEGGPGNDVCNMGAASDHCDGGPGNDRLFGGPSPDHLFGGPGSDYCNGGPAIGKSTSCERGPGN
jgi:hypothetical protein